MFDPLLGGGTLLDIGIYNVFITLSILGKPDIIEATMSPRRQVLMNRSPFYLSIIVEQWHNYFLLLLPTCQLQAEINGTEGCITLTTRFYEPSTTIQLCKQPPGEKEIIPVEKEMGFGYQYEARHVNECLKKGLIESPVMTHADSLLLMEILDRIRIKARIEYPADR